MTHDPLGHLGVERVAQTVAQDVDRQHRHRQEDAGEEDVVRVLVELRAALGHHVAPGRDVGRQAHAQEGQDGLGQDAETRR
jgi:hypothetical protein